MSRNLDELSPDELELFYALQRDNMHMSNEEIIDLLPDVDAEGLVVMGFEDDSL